MAPIKEYIGNRLFNVSNALNLFKLPPEQEHRCLAVLMYHGLESDRHRLMANPLDVDPQACLNEILFFQKQGYTIISSNDLNDFNHLEPGRYLLISFDDGHLNIYHHLINWLQSYKFPVLLGICPDLIDDPDSVFWWEEVRARFASLDGGGEISIEIDGATTRFRSSQVSEFEEYCRKLSHENLNLALEQLRQDTSRLCVNEIQRSRFVHKNMSWNQLKKLAATNLCTVAAHSMSHEIATNLPPAVFRGLSSLCKDCIEARLETEVNHYIYPNGRCSAQTDDVLRECGYRFSYSTEDKNNRLLNSTFRIDRFRGYGLSANRRYYSYLWKQRHAVDRGAG